MLMGLMCRYVYNHSTCGRCGSKISTWDMQARTVYACETCQPLHLDPGTALAPGRVSALQVSTLPPGSCCVGSCLLDAMHCICNAVQSINVLQPTPNID